MGHTHISGSHLIGLEPAVNQNLPALVDARLQGITELSTGIVSHDADTYSMTSCPFPKGICN